MGDNISLGLGGVSTIAYTMNALSVIDFTYIKEKYNTTNFKNYHNTSFQPYDKRNLSDINENYNQNEKRKNSKDLSEIIKNNIFDSKCKV